MAKEKELDNKSYIVNRLLETEREGIEDLIDYMEEIGFFEAPCSSQYHLACQFGLVHHTRNVMTIAENIGYHLLGKKEYERIKDSVIISAALHDLGKCGQFGKQLYVPNILKSGEQSDKKPYEINKDLMTLPHEVVSVIEATKFIDLTEEEQRAIAWHNGLYGCFKYDIQGKETVLYMIIHWADMWASRITEVK